jgi:hypothetical protein
VKRILLVLTVALMMVALVALMAAPALAVAGTNANCQGVHASGDNSFDIPPPGGSGGKHAADKATDEGGLGSTAHCRT